LAARKSITRQLEQVPLFAELKRPQLRELAKVIERIEFRPGVTVCQQGELGYRYFVIEEGALRVTRVDTEGRVLEITQLEEGDGFGETSLLLGDVRDATIEAIAPTVLLSIEKTKFDSFVEENPRVENALRMRPDVAERRGYPRFSWLEEDELPVRVMHKHPMVLITPLALPVILNLMLLLSSLVARDLWGDLIMTVGLVLMLIPTGAGLYFFIDWRNDVYAVTNHRVIHMERIGLLREHFAAAPLHAIQDIQQIYAGPIARFLDYGDLIMETAGEMGQVIFRSVPHLSQVRDIVFSQTERTHARARVDERAAIRKALRHHFVDSEVEEETEQPEQDQERGDSVPPRLQAHDAAGAALLPQVSPALDRNRGRAPEHTPEPEGGGV